MSQSNSQRQRFTRRQFVQTSAGALALAANPYWSLRTLADESKNNRPLVGSIGLGGQGTGIARRASEFGDVVAVCDVQRQHAEHDHHQQAVQDIARCSSSRLSPS